MDSIKFRLSFGILVVFALICGCSKLEASHQAAPTGQGLITPTNDLEVELLKAAAEPNFRPTFERHFLTAYVFMRTDPASVPELQKAIGPDGKLTQKTDIHLWLFRSEHGELVAPMFTSVERLRAVYPGKAWVRLKGHEALQMVKGRTVVVNPSLAPQVTWAAADVAVMRSRAGKTTY